MNKVVGLSLCQAQ